jgi:hypothetical protein
MDHRFGIAAKLHVITMATMRKSWESKTPRFWHFVIVYTGSFYPPKRVITPVMASLKKVKEITHQSTREWHFHYYVLSCDYARSGTAVFEGF